jgi:DNA-binding GntR family transcriptional regulator
MTAAGPAWTILTGADQDEPDMRTALGASVDLLPRSTFREQIAAKLRGAIMDGTLAPGVQIVESRLAAQFGVSRGPLREAIRELINEGLLVSRSYTATFVLELSREDIQEIYSIRTALETFAFELIWDRRDAAFRADMSRRHQVLQAAIDRGDDEASIAAELALHSLVFETTGHKLLISIWDGLKGRLKIYWAAHHRAHDLRGPKRESHDSYIALSLGDSLDAMKDEIRSHMQRGIKVTEAFLETTKRKS